MNYLKAAPQGLDAKIQFAQTELYAELSPSFSKLEGYGRVYKNERNGKIEPEGVKKGKGYTGGLLNRNNKFFFSKASKSVRLGTSKMFSTKVNVYFILDTKEMYPLIAHRADQEAQAKVYEIVAECGFDRVSEIVDTELMTVLSEFKGAYNASKFDDMKPFHIFRIGTEIIYDITKKC